MELIKLIDNQHDQIHQHSKAGIEQVKSVNTELINLISNKHSEPLENLKNQGEQLVNHSDKTTSLLNQQGKQNPKKQHQPQHHRKGNRYSQSNSIHHQLAARTKYHNNRHKKLRIGKVNVVKLRILTEMMKVTGRNLLSLLQETA